jgi:hypothetical protein
MSQPTGWFPDPYGRFQQRYFDGSNWTAHVITDGAQSVDPLGTTVSVPFVPPGSVVAGEASTSTSASASITGFLDTLGPDSRERPAARLSIALAGVGGAAAAAGIATAIIGDSGDDKARTIPAAVVIVVLAYAVRFGVKSHAELRSAAVGAAVLGIPGLAVSTTIGGDGGGTVILAALLLIAAWALPGLRGRPLMLGAGAVAIVLWLTTFGGDSSSDTDLFDFGVDDFIGGKAFIYVLVGIAFLAMVWWLDEHGYRGVGTSLVVAALLAAALAVLKVVQNLGSTGSALLLTIAGLAVAVVGDHGQRRATTWFGVAIAAIGTIAFFTSAFEPGSATEQATPLILSGLLLVVAPTVVKALRASRASQTDV